jgi:hypothetical protein
MLPPGDIVSCIAALQPENKSYVSQLLTYRFSGNRYGADDTLQLAGLLDDLGLGATELSSFMPYSESDFASIFSSVNISLDDLDLEDTDESPVTPAQKPAQTHQIMRFKVPMDDVGVITDLIEKTMKEQRFTDEDSLSNAGNALVHILAKKD